MRIENNLQSQIPSITKNIRHEVAFMSSSRTVYNDSFVLKYNTNTCFLRHDLDWAKFTDYLNKKYKNVDKVNVIDYACSTGEEPVSLSMMLDLKLGKGAEKFYPIMAYDIDEDNIKRASNGVFDIDNSELNLLRKYTGDEYKKYFICHVDKNELQGKLRLINDYKRNIVYEVSDIVQDINKIPLKNTVLLCRNVFPYLTIGDEKNIVKQISGRLDSSSVVVLGKFDIDYGIEKLFEKEGFVHTEQYNVMEKLPAYKALFKKLAYKFKAI